MSEVGLLFADLVGGLDGALVMLRGMRDGRVSSAHLGEVCVEMAILSGEMRRLERLVCEAPQPAGHSCGAQGDPATAKRRLRESGGRIAHESRGARQAAARRGAVDGKCAAAGDFTEEVDA